jgi:hypothetical protein
MTAYQRLLVLLALFAVLAGCNPFASPQPSVSLQSPNEAVAVNCGPLAEASCEQAAEVAIETLGGADGPVLSVEIVSPSDQMTCPPSGGMPGSHACEVIAVVTTTAGTTTVGLVESDGGWMWSALMR